MIKYLLPKLMENSTWGGYTMGDGDVFRNKEITIKRNRGITLVRYNKGE